MYNELIDALRTCGDEPYDITKPCKVSPWKLMRDAADALEAAEKRIDGLQKLVDINTERCEALRKQLRESHENYEKQIEEQQKQIAQLYLLLNNRINEVAELESQMPKQDRGVCMTACGTLYVPNYDD